MGLGTARLCFRPRIFCRRALLDRCGAVCRHRPVLVGVAVRGAGIARVSGAVPGRGARRDRPRDDGATLAGRRAGLPLRGGVERGRMGTRAFPDRAAVEPRRLCLVGRLPGLARDAAERRLGRDLRAELCHGAGRRAAGAARDPVALADGAGAAGRPRACRRAPDPDPGSVRRAAPPAGAGRRDRNLAAAGPALDPRDAEMGPGGGRGEFSPADRVEQRPGRAPARGGAVARSGDALPHRTR